MDSDLLFSLMLGAGAFSGRRRGFKASKPKKQPKDNWFEGLNATQCKELAKAAKLKVSGTKKNLVQRLVEHDFVGQFGGNRKSSSSRVTFQFTSSNIYTLDELKEECRKRQLQVSGTKFDLVLRITQHEHKTGEDHSLKRAASTDNEQPVAKKRKPSMPISPSTMYTRVEKICRASSQKKYQSHWGSKCHGPDVEDLVAKLLNSLEPYTETDPKLVFDCCLKIMSAFTHNYRHIMRPGYMEDLHSIAGTIESYTAQVRASVSQSDLDQLAKVMSKWFDLCDDHFYGDDEYDTLEVVHKIRHGDAVPYDKAKAMENYTPPVGSMGWYEQAKKNGTLKMYHNGKLVVDDAEDKKPEATILAEATTSEKQTTETSK